jgi:predicted phage terminase large subunit-like protein
MSGQRAAKRSAYTVGVKMAIDNNGRYWVLDVIRKQLDSFRRESMIKMNAYRDGRFVWVGQEREPGTGGIDQVLRTLRRMSGFIVRTIPATRNKEQRADGFSEMVNGGNVWLPSSMRTATGWAGWATAYVDEMEHFPFSTTKDQIDASSGAFTALFHGRRRSGPLRSKSTA